MKTLMIVAALAGLVTTTSAFAQSANAGTASVRPAATQVAANAQGSWVPPYGQPVAQKTRAQVYQELVQAEQDGQLAYLNSTLYAH
ncbi:DUF4148 domain-containing protein [Paraburkholderia acidipaludis]|uniref:DUF4148 domain-containing protein n=1 Tax=Paraburkholderia acidipaludis TaxID=660537 RepID=UPI0004872F78|nr:DUF4148 domain-containing protein [Paraburkholderia acidipaludis]